MTKNIKSIATFIYCSKTNELAYYDIFDERYVILGSLYEAGGLYFFTHNHQQPTDGKGNTFNTPIERWVGKIFTRRNNMINYMNKRGGYVSIRWGVCE